MGYVVVGTDVETGQRVKLGDIERRSGLYLLGKSGMGKSALAINIALQDIANGHGLFFLDPHGDAVLDLLRRGDPDLLESRAYFLDAEDEDYSFGINLLACHNVKSRKARMDTYTRAYNVFFKIWEENWGVWLQLILQNVLWTFIENQGYTLADVPMFLNPRNEDFRNHIISNIKYNQAVADFWRFEFFQRREQTQQERVEAALTRINTLLTYPDVHDIVGQEKTTIDFGKLLSQNNIILLKLSANLAEDIKKFIGTILLSELVHAVRNRPEDKRSQFCVFIDEFHNFASTDHMAIMTTEGRKFGIAATYLHVERLGQLAHNQKLLGATQAIVNKGMFQPTVNDANEFAPEFAKDSPTEIRYERQLVISQTPVADLLRGHPNQEIRRFINAYVRELSDHLEDTKEAMEEHRLIRQDDLDVAAKMRLTAQHSRTQDTLWKAQAAISVAQEQTGELLYLYKNSQRLRLALRALDRFLTALMEGQITPKQEAFSAFLSERVRELTSLSTTESELLGLYISLAYGDALLPRVIPFALAQAHRLFPDHVDALCAQAKEVERLKQAEYLKAEYERHDSARKENVAHVQKRKQEFAASIQRRIFNNRDPRYRGQQRLDAIELMKHYLLWREYPSLQQALSPYLTARLAPSGKWRNTPSLSWVLDELQKMKRYNADTFINYRNFLRPTYGRTHYYRYIHVLFKRSALNAFQKFLERYREGALIVLLLLDALYHHYHIRARTEIREYEDYPGSSMLDVPQFENHEPLDVILLLEKLTEMISGFKVKADCAKYYWVSNKQHPYRLPTPSKTPSGDNIKAVSYNSVGVAVLVERIGTPGETARAMEKREDVQDLKQLVEKYPSKRYAQFERDCKTRYRHSEIVINYLLCRACDISRYGQKVADLTFPHPTITGATRQEVADVVSWMISLFEKEAQREEKEWLTRREELVQKSFQSYYANCTLPMPSSLSARVFADHERERVKAACLQELRQSGLGEVVKRVDDFVRFCQLLSLPENHIKVASGQYIERQVNTYSTQEMTNQMAQELVKLPLFQAYTKIIDKSQDKQMVRTHRIQTRPLPEITNTHMEAQALINGYTLGKKRIEIKAKIEDRQKRWLPGSDRPTTRGR